ncbi:MAG: alpha-E domain-containing protein [Rhodospirillales bacterium]
MTRLLARFAECVFWLGRQVERANALARVLDVNQAYSYDARGGRNWRILLRLNEQEEDFLSRNGGVTPEAVLYYHMLDPENHSSVRSCIAQARENARTLRPLISTEMWSQLNGFHRMLLDLTEADATPRRLSVLAARIKENCQTHVGITRETLYRDEAFFFYIMGQQIERADQTTRLLWMKYHQLLPHGAEEGSAVDVSQWFALLRAAAGLQAFSRENPSDLTPEAVAGFLLFNPHFPRSLLCSVNEASDALSMLRHGFGLEAGIAAQSELASFRARLHDATIEQVNADGLDETIDWAQRNLITVTGLIGLAFFGDGR